MNKHYPGFAQSMFLGLFGCDCFFFCGLSAVALISSPSISSTLHVCNFLNMLSSVCGHSSHEQPSKYWYYTFAYTTSISYYVICCFCLKLKGKGKERYYFLIAKYIRLISLFFLFLKNPKQSFYQVLCKALNIFVL